MRYFFTALLLFEICNVFAQDDLIPYRKGDKWGFCNSQKVIVIPCKFQSVDFFHGCDRAVVKMSGRYGYINGVGKMIIPAKYESAGIFYNTSGFDCKTQVTLKGKSIHIDKDGRKLKENECPKVSGACGFVSITSEGIVFKQNGKVGFGVGRRTFEQEKLGRDSIDTLLSPIYDEIIEDEGVLFAKLNGKWGMIGLKSRKIIVSFDYDFISHPDYTRYIVVKKNGLQGVIDKTGTILIPIKYQGSIFIIDEKRLAKVQTSDGKTGYVRFGGVEYFEN